MTYSTLGQSGEFLEYPTNKVIGVFADWEHARAAIDRLSAGGFTQAQIGVLYGPEGAKRLDASGREHGILAQISRFFQGFADMDDKHTKRHEQELLAYALVLAKLGRRDEGLAWLSQFKTTGIPMPRTTRRALDVLFEQTLTPPREAGA